MMGYVKFQNLFIFTKPVFKIYHCRCFDLYLFRIEDMAVFYLRIFPYFVHGSRILTLLFSYAFAFHKNAFVDEKVEFSHLNLENMVISNA